MCQGWRSLLCVKCIAAVLRMPSSCRAADSLRSGLADSEAAEGAFLDKAGMLCWNYVASLTWLCSVAPLRAGASCKLEAKELLAGSARSSDNLLGPISKQSMDRGLRVCF
jgi:hypothetical protein